MPDTIVSEENPRVSKWFIIRICHYFKERWICAHNWVLRIARPRDQVFTDCMPNLLLNSSVQPISAGIEEVESIGGWLLNDTARPSRCGIPSWKIIGY